MVLTAGKGKNKCEGKGGKPEECPEETSGLISIVMNVVINLIGAVVGSWTILDKGESSVD